MILKIECWSKCISSILRKCHDTVPQIKGISSILCKCHDTLPQIVNVSLKSNFWLVRMGGKEI